MFRRWIHGHDAAIRPELEHALMGGFKKQTKLGFGAAALLFAFHQGALRFFLAAEIHAHYSDTTFSVGQG